MDVALPHGTEERLRDAPVEGQLTIEVAHPFPGVDGGEMRWLGRRRPPLAPGQIGHSLHSHLAVAPLLRARPLDGVVHVFGFLLAHPGEVALGRPGAPGVDIDDGEAVAAPVDGITRLEPAELVEVLVVDQAVAQEVVEGRAVLAVRAPLEQRRKAARPVGTVDIGVDRDPIAHGDGHVVLDHHPPSAFRPRPKTGIAALGERGGRGEDQVVRMLCHRLRSLLGLDSRGPSSRLPCVAGWAPGRRKRLRPRPGSA